MRFTKNESGLIEPENIMEYQILKEKRRNTKEITSLKEQLQELRKLLNV